MVKGSVLIPPFEETDDKPRVHQQLLQSVVVVEDFMVVGTGSCSPWFHLVNVIRIGKKPSGTAKRR